MPAVPSAGSFSIVILIDIAQLTDEGRRVVGEEPANLLGLDGDPVVSEAGPIRYDLTVEPAGDQLIVRGEAEASLGFHCSRCDKFFSTTVRVSSFLHAYEWAEHSAMLDVSADVREDLLLEIPGFPLCRADCKGLCAQCGQDLNEATCDCSPATDGLSPWSALDGLAVKPASKPATGKPQAGSK